jgi:hypothetical protein
MVFVNGLMKCHLGFPRCRNHQEKAGGKSEFPGRTLALKPYPFTHCQQQLPGAIFQLPAAAPGLQPPPRNPLHWLPLTPPSSLGV